MSLQEQMPGVPLVFEITTLKTQDKQVDALLHTYGLTKHCQYQNR